MYRMYGLMPIGDTPRSGGWWYHTDLAPSVLVWQALRRAGYRASWPLYVENLERSRGEIARLAQDPKASVVAAVGGATKTREQQVPIIDGLVNNDEGQFQVNVPNQGALEGLPDDVVVEVPAIVNQKGIQPIHVGALPPKIMLEQILPGWLSMERQLLALKTGDRSILLWSVLDNHQTRSYQQGAGVCWKRFSPCPGNGDMNAQFRWPAGWDKVR